MLFKTYKKLDSEGRLSLQNMLKQSLELENAWLLKEQFHEMLHSEKTTDINDLIKWIKAAENKNIPEFKNCIDTLMRW